jgi:FtsZ-binding cell division protein ZapB
MSKLAEHQEIMTHFDQLQKAIDSAYDRLHVLETEYEKLKAENVQLITIIRDMAMKELANA